MNSFFFTLGDGQTHGPVSQRKLASYLESGAINEDTLVMAEGSDEWKPMGVLFEISKIPLPSTWSKSMPPPPEASSYEGATSEFSPPPEENPIAAQIRANLPVQNEKGNGGGIGILRFFGNLIWVISGVFMALGYVIAGVLSMITIIGIGSGIQSFKLANYALWPFGRTIEPGPSSTGCLVSLGNVIWFLLGGVFLSLGHVFWGVVFYIFIITIPLGKKHFELARLALAPYGKRIVKVS